MIHGRQATERYDLVIIGAGIFGLYLAEKASKTGKRILVLEKANEAFSGASYVNQARIHSGYHYPRSRSTALKAAAYKERFIEEFDFAINRTFEQIYAVAKQFTYTGTKEYKQFCDSAGLSLEEITVSKYFNPAYVEAAFVTEEVGVDTLRIKEHLIEKLVASPAVAIRYNTSITSAELSSADHILEVEDKEGKVLVVTPEVINVTYAGLNDILKIFKCDLLPLKYEYAEMIMVRVPQTLATVGITVMDGPFFSLMPFGFSGSHSLSAVSYTPHSMSTMDSQANVDYKSHFHEMRQLVNKFLARPIELAYERSLFATKTVLSATELDDARPTFIMRHRETPALTSVLSGKLNTIYDLDQLV